MVVKRLCFKGLYFLSFFLLFSVAFAKDVTLEWDSNIETDLLGYLVEYDNESHLAKPGDKSPPEEANFNGADAQYPSPIFLTDEDSDYENNTLSGITIEGIWVVCSNPRIFVSGTTRVQFVLSHSIEEFKYYNLRAYDTEGLVSSRSNEVGTRPYSPYNIEIRSQ